MNLGMGKARRRWIAQPRSLLVLEIFHIQMTIAGEARQSVLMPANPRLRRGPTGSGRRLSAGSGVAGTHGWR